MKAEIGIYTLSTKWEEFKNRDKSKYEGNLSISLTRGSLNWEIKPEWVEEFKNQNEAETGKKLYIGYNGFRHHTVVIKYVYRIQSTYFFGKLKQFLNHKLEC